MYTQNKERVQQMNHDHKHTPVNIEGRDNLREGKVLCDGPWYTDLINP